MDEVGIFLKSYYKLTQNQKLFILSVSKKLEIFTNIIGITNWRNKYHTIFTTDII